MENRISPTGKPLRLGARRVRITLLTPVEAPDILGGAAITFADVATLWARVEALGGTEDVSAGRAQGLVRTRITLRWRGDVDARMRIRHGTRLFAIIIAFDPDGRRRNLICQCEEITP